MDDRPSRPQMTEDQAARAYFQALRKMRPSQRMLRRIDKIERRMNAEHQTRQA
jgi:hypothetical protein